MSKYVYTPKTNGTFEEIAEKIRDLFPHRAADGLKTDIEGIIDDLDFRIIPRRWPERLGIEGYAAADPRVIVLPEVLYSNPRQKRCVLAEELAHRILEYELWAKPLPPGALCHELADDQYEIIEIDAENLVLALLLPERPFVQQFNTHARALAAGIEPIGPKGPLKEIRSRLSTEFDVDFHMVSKRMHDLGLINDADYKHLVPIL